MIEVIVNDVKIVYDEYENKWVFELRGRERRVDSLKKAKEIIAKPPKNSSSKPPFTRIPVYFIWYNDEVVTGEVTSLIGNERCWFTGKNGQRLKERVTDIYPVNEGNTKRINEFITLLNQREKINEEMDRKVRELVSLDVWGFEGEGGE